MDGEMYSKIIQKKEFSRLPKKDVEIAFSNFEKRQVSDLEKIRLTRELLHKSFGAFTSRKLLSPKNKSEEWILRKHLSSRERLDFYWELYKRILHNEVSVIDLGCGVNGFSHKFFEKKINYLGIESVGQLVDLMNDYFKRNKFSKAKAVHASLFELEKVKKIIKGYKNPKIIFLFKVLDSLETLKPDYSKELLMEISPLAEKVVVSFATESMIKREKFKVKRNWILNFIKDNFKVLDDFELGSERYVSFSNQ